MSTNNSIQIFITGGTFDKSYDYINGDLYFEKTHIPGWTIAKYRPILFRFDAASTMFCSIIKKWSLHNYARAIL